jgi:hypothetical protein
MARQASGVTVGAARSTKEEQIQQNDHRDRHADQPQNTTLAHHNLLCSEGITLGGGEGSAVPT